MKSEQLIAAAFAMALMQGCAHAEQPSTTPLSPNYCARFVCLQIDRLSDEDTSVESVSRRMQTEIEIRNRHGVTRLTLMPGDQIPCDQTSVIRLRETYGKYQGSGCLSTPSSTNAKIEVVFTPITAAGKERNPVGFPLFGAWAVDEAPVSFWEKGYSLRLGAAVRFNWDTSK